MVIDTASNALIRMGLVRVGLILCLAFGLVGCAEPVPAVTAVLVPTLPPSPEPMPVPTATTVVVPTLPPSPEPSPAVQVYENSVMGIRLSYPVGDRIEEEQYLFSEYGFWLVDAAKQPVLSVAWFYQDSAADLQTVVNAATREADHGLPIRQSPLQVAGYPALALYGMPGMYDNVQIYLAAHDRLYRLLYAGAELDQAARQLLDGFKVISATKTLESLHLPTP